MLFIFYRKFLIDVTVAIVLLWLSTSVYVAVVTAGGWRDYTYPVKYNVTRTVYCHNIRVHWHLQTTDSRSPDYNAFSSFRFFLALVLYLWGHWYPCFWNNSYICPGFQSKARSLSGDAESLAPNDPQESPLMLHLLNHLDSFAVAGSVICHLLLLCDDWYISDTQCKWSRSETNCLSRC